jgi:predicted Ser/Thr protein kinase
MKIVTDKLIREAPNFMQADVYYAKDDNGVEYVIKDASHRPKPAKSLYIRRALQHEHDMLYQLQAVSGVPRVFGFDGPDKLVMAYLQNDGTLPGNRENPPEKYPPLKFFQQFRQMIDQIHEFGIAHGDIRRRNILMCANNPCLIDFATAVQANGRPKWLRNCLFKFVKKVDCIKALKLQQAYYPKSLTAEEIELLGSKPLLLRLGQFCRKRIYRRFFKQKHWKRAWRKYQASRTNEPGNGDR